MFLEHYLKIYVKINLILLPFKSEQFMNNLYLQIYIYKYNIKHCNIINNNDHLKVTLRTKDLISFYEKSREHITSNCKKENFLYVLK